MKNFGILSFLGGGRDGRSSNAKLSRTRRIRSRRLMLEGLESREMLSVTSGAETVADSAFIAPQATAADGTATNPVVASVSTWADLTETINNNTGVINITITADIDLLTEETDTDEIEINANQIVTITGAGTSLKIITGTFDYDNLDTDNPTTVNATHRAFKINSGGQLNLVNTSLGFFSSVGNGGIVIVNRDATLTLDNVQLEYSLARNGGAICNYGTVTTPDFPDYSTTVVFDSNIATNFGGTYFGCGVLNLSVSGLSEFRYCDALTGGAIYSAPHTFDTDTDNVEPTSITISGFQFDTNSAISELPAVGMGNGGAIANWGTATFKECSIQTSNATNDGGAIFNGTGGNLTVDDCSIHSGKAAYGGAISNFGILTLKGGRQDISNCTASQNGGAIANNLGATLNFDNCIYQFYLNNADRYGGAIISVGTVTFNNATLSFINNNNNAKDDNTSPNNTQSESDGIHNWLNYNFGDVINPLYKGCDVADGSGQRYFTNWANLPTDSMIYDYKWNGEIWTPDTALAQLGTTLSLDELADSGTVQIDADNDGIFEATGLLSTAGMSVGANTVNLRYVNCAGGVIEEAITLNVASVAPTIDVAVSEFNDGTIVKLDFDVYSDTLTKTWVVGWGDGQTSEYTCYANALCATHLYARGSETAVYNMTLERIDVNGLGVGTVYSIGTHVVPAVVLPSTAATPEMDSFTAVAAAPVAPAVTESDEILPLFYPIVDEEDDLDFVTPQTVPLCAAPETVEEIIFEYDLF